MEIKLQILAKDIKNNGYIYHGDCPITRALKRAGFDYSDGGTSIYDNQTNQNIVTNENSTYNELANKVVRMYNTKSALARKQPLHSKCIPIKDFEHVLIF